MTRTALLFAAASSLALAITAPADAATYLFGGTGDVPEGQPIETGGKTVQIRLDDGAVVSLVGDASFTLSGGAVTVARGTVTVVGGTQNTVINLPDGSSARVAGSANFTVSDKSVAGHVLNGTLSVGESSYRRGTFFRANAGDAPRRVFANAPQTAPGAVQSQRSGGIAAAAQNGVPISLGEALAAVGASGDVVNAARQIALAEARTIPTLPSGDVATLLQFSDALAAALGQLQVADASPVLVNSYLRFLADGGRIAEFQSAYLAIVNQYLQLLAAGGVSGDFDLIDAASLNAYLAYIAQSGLIEQLAAQQQAIVTAYLTYLQGGGAPGGFVLPGSDLNDELAASYAALIAQYIAFLQGGGIPSQFTGATPALIAQYLAALDAAGVFDAILGAQAEILRAYLAFVQGGGNPADFDGFDTPTVPPVSTDQKLAALSAFVAHVNGGGAPSAFTGESQSVLQAYYGDFSASRQLTAENRALLDAYFQYVTLFGSGDNFPGLAINGGSVITVQSAYAYANDAGTQTSTFGTVGANPLLIDADKLPFGGAPANGTVLPLRTGSSYAQYVEAEGLTVARITGGEGFDASPFSDTANGGLHFAYAPAISNLPTDATFAYELVAATNPTFADGSSTPGTFDADIVIAYSGSALRLATEGMVTMPGDATYNFSTAGGLNGVADLDPTSFASSGGAFIQQLDIPITGTGRACASGADCSLFMVALPGGDGASKLAVSYESRNGGEGAVPFVGAAGFVSTGAFTPSTGGGDGGGDGGNGGGGIVVPPAPGVDTSGPATAIAANPGYEVRSAYGSTTTRATFIATGPLTLDGLGYAAQVGTNAFQTNYFLNKTAQHYDGFGDADLILGRYSGGDVEIRRANNSFGANQGFHYAVSIGPENVVFPTEGYAIYDLLAATRPTLQSGNLAPGVFDARMGVGFGGGLKIAFEGTLTMPDDATYSFSNSGGVANVLNSGTSFNSAAGFAFSQQLTGTGLVCPAAQACEIRFSGSFTGDTGNKAVVSYLAGTLFANPALDYAAGAAAFAINGDGVIVPPPPDPDPEPEPLGTEFVAYSASTIGIDIRNESNIDTDNAGKISGYQFSAEEAPTIGTATAVEAGRIANVIGWARWTGGTTAGTYYSLGGVDVTGNKGWHLVDGTPATNLPTSGTVQYQLAGATAPTIRDGSLTPGSFSGDLGVTFGADPRVGIAFNVGIGGHSYAIVTPGGAGDPMNGGMALTVDPSSPFHMTFGATGGQVTVNGNGPVCAGQGACSADIRGFLAGDGASHVGVAYTFGNTGFGTQVDGVAAFAAP